MSVSWGEILEMEVLKVKRLCENGGDVCLVKLIYTILIKCLMILGCEFVCSVILWICPLGIYKDTILIDW